MSPMAPKHPCKQPGCPGLTHERYCEQHQHLAKRDAREIDRRRPNAADRGYGTAWQKARKAFLMRPENVLCVKCKELNRFVPATVVDHIIPHRGDQKLFWSESNWQPLCRAHHSSKTASADGGYGNPYENK